MGATDYVVGVDIGGTRMKIGAVAFDQSLFGERTLPSGYARSPEDLLADIEREVAAIRREHPGTLVAIGLGFPGAVRQDQGVVMLPGKLRLEGFPIVPRLAASTKIPVIADNDGRLAILAEIAYGRARDDLWAVAITLGTGVGSGVLLDGHILRDPHLQFGTQASHIVQQSGSCRWCITEAPGTPNILCSATALAQLVRDGLQRGLPSVLTDTYHADPHSIDFEAVIGGVEAGDPLCARALAAWRQELGWFLVSVARMYTPEIIYLSGGPTRAAAHFLPNVNEHVNTHLYRYPMTGTLPVVVSGLGEFAGVMGAAALAWDSAKGRKSGPRG
ncbi:MAG: ROK family protein [Bacteroidota bacterium]|nr:ROK family protein [Bacteroidota bacterium]